MAEVAIGLAASYLAPAGYGAIAYSIASGAAAYFLAPKPEDQVGPRLEDLKVQTASFGQPIPRVYGRVRVAGNVIWPYDLQLDETKHKDDVGGKGGQEQTVITYTYDGDFAIGICEGPIQGIRRIWADNKLVYDYSDSTTPEGLIGSDLLSGHMTVYLGSEDQLPDSTIEAAESAGAPAFRGLAYVVFKDLQLADFGNRIPNFEFEVIKSGATETYTLSDQTNQAAPVSTAGHGWTITTPGSIVYYAPGKANAVEVEADIEKRDLDQNTLEIETQTYSNEDGPIGGGSYTEVNVPVRGLQNIMTGVFAATSGARYYVWFRDGGCGSPLLDASGNDIRATYGSGTIKSALYSETNESVYIIAPDSKTIMRFKAGQGIPDTLAKQQYTMANVCCLGMYEDKGLLYVASGPAGSGKITVFSKTLAVVDTYTESGSSNIASTTYAQILVQNGRALFGRGDSGYWYLYDINSDDTLTLVTSAQAAGAATAMWPVVSGGAMLVRQEWITIGIFSEVSLNGSDVIGAECTYSGILSASDIDVTGVTGTITGYAVPRVMSPRAALEPVMRFLRVDAVESDGKIKFVERGGSVAYVIDADDIGAGVEDADTNQSVIQRMSHAELPNKIRVNYIDGDNQYNIGSQVSNTTIADSANDPVIEYPIVMSADEAAQAAEIDWQEAQLSKSTHEIKVPYKYLGIDPTDVIQYPVGNTTYTITVTEIEYGDFMTIRGVFESATLHASTATGVDHTAPTEPPTIPGETKLQIVDCSLLQNGDDGNGLSYAFVRGYASGWNGAQVYKSSDSGNTYQASGTLLDAATMGKATTALADGDPTSIDWSSTVTVEVNNALSSVSGADNWAKHQNVANGCNWAILGVYGNYEIIGFATATLVSGTTYTLSGLIRGLLGTEHATGGHLSVDNFILLTDETGAEVSPAIMLAGLPEVGLRRYYKGVSIGNTLSSALTQSYLHSNEILKPHSPVWLRGDRDGSSNIDILWQRRSRYQGAPFHSPPIGESSKQYRIQIYSDGTYTTVTRTATATTESYQYTSANQVADFGSNQNPVYVGVAQYSPDLDDYGYEAQAAI